MTNTIQIVRHQLSVMGLKIEFKTENHTKRLYLAPAITAKLLRDCNYIKDFDFSDEDGLLIKREITEVVSVWHSLKRRLVGHEIILWDYFVSHFDIDEQIASEIVMLNERNKILETA